MNEYLLYEGQYLGEVIKSYEIDLISIKSTLHEKSESKFHAHRNSYLSILLSGLYSEVTLDSQKIISPCNILFRPAHYRHKNQFITEQTKCFNIEFSPEWFDKHDMNSKKIKPQIKNIQNYPFVIHLLVDFLKHRKIDFFEDLLLQLIAGEDEVMSPLRKPWLDKLIRILDNEIEENHS